MAKIFSFDNPITASHAWARYRRLMRFMFCVTTAVVIIALVAIYREVGPVSPHLFIATALGIGFAMLLMSALMGLVFLSSDTGHDQAVEDVSKGQSEQDKLTQESKDEESKPSDG